VSTFEAVNQRLDTMSSVMNPGETKKEWEIPFKELEILSQIEKGSRGILYVAKWRGTKVAVRQLATKQWWEEQKALVEFAQELFRLANLRQHPNVIQFLGGSTSPLVVVTELIDGQTLLSQLQDRTVTLAPEHVVKIIKSVAAGIYHVHSEGIIHRDICARNVVVCIHRCKMNGMAMMNIQIPTIYKE